jgi:hypothetical protein
MKRSTYFYSDKIFFLVLYSENVCRPWKEWFVPKYISAESVSESEKNFVDPNPNKKFSDPQHCLKNDPISTFLVSVKAILTFSIFIGP